MNAFVRKHADAVIGCLSGFDRLVFRGTLRCLSYADGLRGFLAGNHILLKDFGRFMKNATEYVKTASLGRAEDLGRPIEYLRSPDVRKDELARKIAERDSISEGLICVLTAVEPCWSYAIRGNRETKKLELVREKRKGLKLYHYMMHPRFGFCHVRIQTWLPFDIQIWINGREWLSRMLDRRGLSYTRRGNAFTWLQNVERTQALADTQLKVSWPSLLAGLLKEVHPAHRDIFGAERLEYYWSLYQSEWATDVMFRNAESLASIYPRLVRHGIAHFGSRDVMRFLGRKLTATGRISPRFMGEVVSDLRDRPEGMRIKHSIDWNSIKAYDKEGSILRIETTINRPQDFKVFRPREGDEGGPRAWRAMRQGIADLHRRAEVSQAANDRYLDALAAITEETPLSELLARVAAPAFMNRRRFRALNPAARDDVALLAAVNRGEFTVRGFRNAEIRELLFGADPEDDKETRRRAARVTRLIRLLRAHGLVAKVQKTHRYTLTPVGRRAIAAILAARDASVEQLTAKAA